VAAAGTMNVVNATTIRQTAGSAANTAHAAVEAGRRAPSA